MYMTVMQWKVAGPWRTCGSGKKPITPVCVCARVRACVTVTLRLHSSEVLEDKIFFYFHWPHFSPQKKTCSSLLNQFQFTKINSLHTLSIFFTFCVHHWFMETSLYSQLLLKIDLMNSRKFKKVHFRSIF